AGQSRAAGQGPVGVGGDVGQHLEEGVTAQGGGVVAVGVAGQQLVDQLGEQGHGGVGAVLDRARVGEGFGQAGEYAQAAVQGADGQQAGVGDDAGAVEGDADLLRADRIEGKVGGSSGDHELGPPYWSKISCDKALDSTRGPSLTDSVRNPG